MFILNSYNISLYHLLLKKLGYYEEFVKSQNPQLCFRNRDNNSTYSTVGFLPADNGD
ncbi:hypothetical protein HanPSC8_Chr05g0223311 [Helianthus annuus]|nr:hypothetical protein HanPSC8_Chr05g0223311 [Helianthus annuus]